MKEKILSDMISFNNELQNKLKNDKEYAILWLEGIVEELRAYIKAIKEEK